MTFKREQLMMPVHSDITRAAVQLALMCAKHNRPLEGVTEALQLAVVKQAGTIERQAEIIRKLEQQLGIDDDL